MHQLQFIIMLCCGHTAWAHSSSKMLSMSCLRLQPSCPAWLPCSSCQQLAWPQYICTHPPTLSPPLLCFCSSCHTHRRLPPTLSPSFLCFCSSCQTPTHLFLQTLLLSCNPPAPLCCPHRVLQERGRELSLPEAADEDEDADAETIAAATAAATAAWGADDTLAAGTTSAPAATSACAISVPAAGVSAVLAATLPLQSQGLAPDSPTGL